MSIGPISDYDSWKLASPYDAEPEPEEETMETTAKTPTEMSDDRNIATMTSAKLEQHIAALEQKHRIHMRALRALARARKTEEDAK